MKIAKWVGYAVLAGVLAGCAALSQGQQRVVSGAAMGGALGCFPGAVLGGATGAILNAVKD